MWVSKLIIYLLNISLLLSSRYLIKYAIEAEMAKNRIEELKNQEF